jgi:hypothetical protein
MFNPSFVIVHNLDHCAGLINAPHEPKAVQQTKEAVEMISRHKEIITIGEFLIRQVHEHICYWLEPRGVYRNIPVRIGDQVLDHFPVAQQMRDLHPFLLDDKLGNTLKTWYRLFQEIHPFEDGNGRVGGAIIAGISYARYGYYLTPDELPEVR